MAREHSVVREGILTGLVGGLVVAVWYVLHDVGQGQLGHTPNVLGQVFIQRDTMPTVQTVSTQAVLDYSLLHFASFFILGIALTWLAHLASRNPTLRMGVWLGLVIAFVFFLGLMFMLYTATDQRFPWLATLVGGALGIGSMTWVLWRRHPHLRGTFDQSPLGSEVKPPPHPPVRSRP